MAPLPMGSMPSSAPQLTTQWAAYETELFYVANVYLEQKFLDDKLLVAIGKLGHCPTISTITG